MKKARIFLVFLILLSVLLVGCTDPKSSGGETSAQVPSLNQPGSSDQPADAPSGASEISETNTGATPDVTPPATPDTTPASPDSEVESYGPGDLTPDPDPTIDIGDGSFELVGGD